MRRALVPLVLAAALAGCGIVAGLGDAPSYVESNDGAPGVGGANVTGVGGAGVTGTGGSTNQPDGSVANAGGAIGAAGNDLGRGGDQTVSTCVINCPEASTIQSEASVISNCRGANCPVDAGDTPEAGPCAAPGASCVAMPVGWQPAALTQMGPPCPSGLAIRRRFHEREGRSLIRARAGVPERRAARGTATLNDTPTKLVPTARGPLRPGEVSFSPSCQTGNSGDILTGNSYTLSNVCLWAGRPVHLRQRQRRASADAGEPPRSAPASAICPSGVCLNLRRKEAFVSKRPASTCVPPTFPTVRLCRCQGRRHTHLRACSCDRRQLPALSRSSSTTTTLVALSPLRDDRSSTLRASPRRRTSRATQPSREHKIAGMSACAETSPSVPAGKSG